MSLYGSRALRGFASGEQSTSPWYSFLTAAPATWQYEPGYVDPGPVGPDGIPYYLARPDEPSKPLPNWVLPVAVGGGVFVLLGGLGLVFGRRKRRK